MLKKVEEYFGKAGITHGQYAQLMAECGYMLAPASKGHHLNHAGGLAVHSVNVTDNILRLSAALGYSWPREESPYIVGMFHDLVKCKCYKLSGGEYKYVYPGWSGHGEASLAILTVELGMELRPEEAAAIRHHMGLWGLSEKEVRDFNDALGIYSQPIIITHTADWWAARVDEEGVFEAP